jgi:regulator of nonsense transcripts 1
MSAFSSDFINPVVLRYQDGYHYQNVFGPLVKLEADFDKYIKESQTTEDVYVVWDVGLNKRIVARLQVPKRDGGTKTMYGDELRLHHKESDWSGSGIVTKVDPISDEVTLEMRFQEGVPTHLTRDFTVYFVWKPVGFDRMQAALKKMAVDEEAVSDHIYRRLLGMEVEDVVFRCQPPSQFSAPNLPTLNKSQVRETVSMDNH